MERISNSTPNEGQPNWRFAIPDISVRGNKPFMEQPMEQLPKTHEREGIRADERTEILSKAFEKLVNNENLYERFIHAVAMKENGSVGELSAIENLFIHYCIDLSPQEIKIIVESFLTNCKRWFSGHKDKIVASRYLEEKITKGEGILYSEGIISVIEYIKFRRESVKTESNQEIEFYVNSTYDAQWGIDLFELIQDRQSSVPSIQRMNLVQIKTGKLEDWEIALIQKNHEGWLNGPLLDFNALEKWYVEDPQKQIEKAKKLIDNLGAIETIFTDICTSPTSLSADEMLSKLGLDTLSDKGKAWIVWKYIPVLISHLEQARKDGAVDDDGYYNIKQTLQSVHDELTARARLPRNLVEIKEIYSTVVYGGKITEKALVSKGKLLSYKAIEKK